MHIRSVFHKLIISAVLPSLAAFAGQESSDPSALQVWHVDPLVKVFRDARPETGGRAVVQVARGEHATFRAARHELLSLLSGREERKP